MGEFTSHAQSCHKKRNGSVEGVAAQTERAGGHSATRLLLPCLLTCLARWSLRMKRRLHSWQQNRFSPV